MCFMQSSCTALNRCDVYRGSEEKDVHQDSFMYFLFFVTVPLQLKCITMPAGACFSYFLSFAMLSYNFLAAS